MYADAGVVDADALHVLRCLHSASTYDVEHIRGRPKLSAE